MLQNASSRFIVAVCIYIMHSAWFRCGSVLLFVPSSLNRRLVVGPSKEHPPPDTVIYLDTVSTASATGFFSLPKSGLLM